MSNNNVYIAIDTSYEHGLVTLIVGNKPVKTVTLEGKKSHAKNICFAIKEVMSYAKQHSLCINAFFVGLGPGSFVGVRVALATALGFSFGYPLKLMGFCSVTALAYSYQGDKSDKHYAHNIGIAMYASRGLYYHATLTRDSLSDIKVLRPCEINKLLSPIDVLISNDENIFKELSLEKPKRMIHSRGTKDIGIAKAIALKLSTQKLRDESLFIKPNYIKPPSITKPKKISKHLNFYH